MTMNESKSDNDALCQKAAQCLELMRSKHKSTREEALAELKALPTSDIMDVLLTTWRKDREALYRVVPFNRSRTYQAVTQVIPLILGVAAVYYLPFPWGLVLLLVPVAAALVKVYSALPGLRRSKFRGLAIYELLNASNDPRSVMIACDLFIAPPDKWIETMPGYSTVIEKLVKLLPEVTPEMPGTLDARQRDNLRTQLLKLSRMKSLSETQARIGTAMLQYVTNMGDLRALPAIERIAQRQTEDVGESIMIERARSCLSILKQLKLSGKVGEGMLRASKAPPNQDAVLLRAVSQTDSALQEAELLRAHSNEVK